MADTKITGLTADADPQPADLLATVDDPSGTPVTKKATIQNVLKSVDDLTADTAPLAADLLMTIDDPGGTPVPKKSVISDIVGYVVTTAGDIIYATASRTLARLAIGTAGQALKVNSGATAPEWGDTGYAISGVAGILTAPLDSTVYYSGMSTRGPTPTEGLYKISIPLAGTVVAAYVTFEQNATTGTTETSTVAFRLNATTDTTISSAVQNDQNVETFSNTGLSITVAAGDSYELKWTTPAWATDPTNVRIHSIVFIRPT